MNDVTTKELLTKRRWWQDFHRRRSKIFRRGSQKEKLEMAEEMEALGMCESARIMRLQAIVPAATNLPVGNGQVENSNG